MNKHYTVILEEPYASVNRQFLKKCPQHEDYWIAWDGPAYKRDILHMIHLLRGKCKRPRLFVGKNIGKEIVL
jgi:hypothetical protein